MFRAVALSLQLEDQGREPRHADFHGVRPAVAFDGIAPDAAQVAAALAAVLGRIGVDALDPAPGSRLSRAANSPPPSAACSVTGLRRLRSGSMVTASTPGRKTRSTQLFPVRRCGPR